MIRTLAAAALLFVFQDAPEKSAPFTGVRWDGEVTVVCSDGEWLPLVSVNAIPIAKIIDFCKTKYEDRWKKRFGEDLVDVLKKLGDSPKASVELELTKDGATIKRSAAMTRANRDAVSKSLREWKPLYEFDSARIVYKYSGDFEGTETFWAAEQGKVLVLERNKKIGQWDKKTSFVKDEKATTWDPETKKFYTSALRPSDIDLSVLNATESSMKLIGLLKKGNEDVAGKTCVLYEKLEGDVVWRSWRWKGIELKIEAKNLMKTNYVKEATLVEEGAKIPPELLKVPEGYTGK